MLKAGKLEFPAKKAINLMVHKQSTVNQMESH